MNAYNAAVAYKNVDRFGTIEGASPHRLTSMLMQGVLDNIAIAKGMMERSDYSGKATYLNKSLAIIAELKASLNKEKGGVIAQNLESLYDYMSIAILESSSQNSSGKLDEVAFLMTELLESWNSIPEQERFKSAR